MTKKALTRIVQHLRRHLDPKDAGRLGDAELLRRYVQQRDEAAFESLVCRHGPMVLGVSQRVIRNRADAEDVFQATFLILARKASAICGPARLGSWLHGVAFRVAMQAREAARKRRAKEAAAVASRQNPEDRLEDLAESLDREIARLPEHLRTVVILLDLEGKTRREAAGILRCPEGTIASRLSRARGLLRKRLGENVPSTGLPLLSGLLARESLAQQLPFDLLSGTVQAAMQFSSRKAAVGIISENVRTLAGGALKAMFIDRIWKTTAMVLMLGILTIGSSLVLGKSRASYVNDEKDENPAKVLTQSGNNEGLPVGFLDILSAYQFNEAAANVKYDRKQIRLSFGMQNSRVKRIRPGYDPNDWHWIQTPGKPGFPDYVLIISAAPTKNSKQTQSSEPKMDLVLGFGEDAEKQLASLSRECSVVAEGQCIGRTTTRNGREIVCLANCKIVSITVFSMQGAGLTIKNP
jgi:RNA polymerase sigma factor (sigma-70 family)